jgi:hypothetical protein
MADAYIGDTIRTVDRVPMITLSRAIAVIVSGSQPCGHMLMNAEKKEGWYFHVTELKNFPRFMGYEGYKRYLRENDNEELARMTLKLRHPERALYELDRLLCLEWPWLPVPEWSCVGFVSRIVTAGGASLYSACPRLYTSGTDFTPQQR